MKLQRYSEKVLLASIATLLTGCAGSPVQTSQVTYENAIRDVVTAHCAECHGATAPSMADFKNEKDKYTQEKLGPRMDTYENLMVMVNGSDTGAIMRRLDDGANTKDGKPGNMHKYLGPDDPPAGSAPLHHLSLPSAVRAGWASNLPDRPLDSGQAGTAWHRLYLEADIPPGCGVRILLAAGDDVRAGPPRPDSSEWHEHRFGAIFARGARGDSAASETPSERSP